MHRMGLEQERSDDTKIPAAAPDRPEQVLVLILVHRHTTAVGKHHIRADQVVDSEPEAPREMAQPAAERQSTHTRGRNDARRHRQPERVGSVIHIGTRAPAPAALVPPPPMEPNRSFSRPNRTAAITSAASVQRAISSGLRSNIPL